MLFDNMARYMQDPLVAFCATCIAAWFILTLFTSDNSQIPLIPVVFLGIGVLCAYLFDEYGDIIMGVLKIAGFALIVVASVLVLIKIVLPLMRSRTGK